MWSASTISAGTDDFSTEILAARLEAQVRAAYLPFQGDTTCKQH